MPEIARAVFLSWRTVQTCIPHILAELGGKSRMGGRLRSAASGHLPHSGDAAKPANKNHVRCKASSDDHCSLPAQEIPLKGARSTTLAV
jgi:hypothetical protein